MKFQTIFLSTNTQDSQILNYYKKCAHFFLEENQFKRFSKHNHKNNDTMFWIHDENSCYNTIVLLAVTEQVLQGESPLWLLTLPCQWGGWGFIVRWEADSQDSWHKCTKQISQTICCFLSNESWSERKRNRGNFWVMEFVFPMKHRTAHSQNHGMA